MAGVSSNKKNRLVSKAVERRMKVPAGAWDQLAVLCYRNEQMEKAVEAMTKALILGDGKCRTLTTSAYVACFDYLKEKGDAKKEDKFVKLLREQGIFRLY